MFAIVFFIACPPYSFYYFRSPAILHSQNFLRILKIMNNIYLFSSERNPYIVFFTFPNIIFFTFGAIHHFFTNFTAIFAFGVYFFLFAFLAIINRKFRVYISLFYCRLKTPQRSEEHTSELQSQFHLVFP